MDVRKSNVLILGGTGTLGRAIAAKLLEEAPGVKITVLSRGEHKQAEMRRDFPGVRYVIGDIRDRSSIERHFAGKHIVFHVAALKHVDTCELNPIECIKTNEIGSINAAECAVDAKVDYFVFSSTDKAVDPINQYGRSKGSAECIMHWMNTLQTRTKFSVYRWGNVLGSQGSIIPEFAKSIKRDGVARVTDISMTRFWLPIDLAVTYMLHTFHHAYLDQAMICPNMKTASVVDVVKCVSKILGTNDMKIAVTGIRPGEKLHEAMISRHLGDMSSDTFPDYSESELIELLRPVVEAT